MAQMTWLVPGAWAHPAELAEAALREGLRIDGDTLQVEGDPRPIELFFVPPEDAPRDAFARPLRPLPAELARAIGDARTFVALVIPLSIERDGPLLASIGRALERAGGLAVRIEDSGHVHAWRAWVEALERRDLVALHDLAVMTVADRDSLFTCGMHLFERPDAECPRDESDGQVAATLRALGLYQLLESPSLTTGHTFTPFEGAARRELVRWPDARHDPRGPLHNPYGLWRLASAGVRTRSATELALTPMPPLVSILLAEERRLGRPLREPEVVALRERAMCIALRHEDARRLEIERGYADVDPALAWEQWQIVRARS